MTISVPLRATHTSGEDSLALRSSGNAVGSQVVRLMAGAEGQDQGSEEPCVQVEHADWRLRQLERGINLTVEDGELARHRQEAGDVPAPRPGGEGAWPSGTCRRGREAPSHKSRETRA